MGYETLILEKENRIATLKFNRPEKLNAINVQMTEELPMAVDEVRQDDDIRVLVVTGTGRGFCSGFDISALSYFSGEGEQSRRLLLALQGTWGTTLAELEKPVIAAVNGMAAGAGLSLALMCDMRIASENARFMAAWAKRALIPDLGATYFLPRILGIEKALELMYLGDQIDAKEALRIGLVGRVVPHTDLMQTAVALAERLAKCPPISTELTKRAVYKSVLTDLRSQLEFETYAQNICLKTQDAKESAAAFLEKREPKFEGK